MKYRHDTGTAITNAVDVIRFEIFELGNTDILDTMKQSILKDDIVTKTFDELET